MLRNMPLLTMLSLLMKHGEAIEDKAGLHTTLTAIIASIRTIQPCQGVIATLNVALFASQQGRVEETQAWLEEAIQAVEKCHAMEEKEKCHAMEEKEKCHAVEKEKCHAMEKEKCHAMEEKEKCHAVEKEKCHTTVLRALLRVPLPKEVLSSYAERIVESDKKESNLSLRNALLCQCAMMYALKTAGVRGRESV